MPSDAHSDVCFGAMFKTLRRAFRRTSVCLHGAPGALRRGLRRTSTCLWTHTDAPFDPIPRALQCASTRPSTRVDKCFDARCGVYLNVTFDAPWRAFPRTDVAFGALGRALDALRHAFRRGSTCCSTRTRTLTSTRALAHFAWVATQLDLLFSAVPRTVSRGIRRSSTWFRRTSTCLSSFHAHRMCASMRGRACASAHA